MFKTKKNEKTDVILTVNADEDDFLFKFDNSFNENCEDKPWIILGHTQFRDKLGYKLREGDYIKLGKVIFKIKEMKVDDEQIINVKSKMQKSLKKDKTVGDLNRLMTEPIYQNHDTQTAKICKNPKYLPKCRICLTEDNEIDNPMITLPCSCRGSLRFLHIECLQRWLKSKLSSKIFNFLIVHSFKALECDICKQEIPGIL